MLKCDHLSSNTYSEDSPGVSMKRRGLYPMGWYVLLLPPQSLTTFRPFISCFFSFRCLKILDILTYYILYTKIEAEDGGERYRQREEEY